MCAYDITHLPELRERDGVTSKFYLYIAIDHASCFVHPVLKNDEATSSATAFLDKAPATFPFRIIHVLTDRGFCFTARSFEEACRSDVRRPQRPALAHPAQTAWSNASKDGCCKRSVTAPSPAIAIFKLCWRFQHDLAAIGASSANAHLISFSAIVWLPGLTYTNGG
ncbi:DDE-type integrase/transposase/recombinase [Labrys portucalensis]|uniref:DDE-type integrase/transposase/recombinase n=1 Tax=Labrys neptuniae TaxID=376174 RepID=A0ABV6ZRZ1_9HYPH